MPACLSLLFSRLLLSFVFRVSIDLLLLLVIRMVRACMAKRYSAPLSHDCDACADYDGDDDGGTHLHRSCHYGYIHRRGCPVLRVALRPDQLIS
jgi:hypothetical protein